MAWLFCAAEWVHFSFPQGVLLDDSHGLWTETKDTLSKAKRTMKFREGEKIPTKIIARLVKQAVANNKAGKKVKFTPGSNHLEDVYWQRPYYQQKGYIQWTSGTKTDATRVKRITKMVEELQENTYMPPKRNRI